MASSSDEKVAMGCMVITTIALSFIMSFAALILSIVD